MADLRIDTNSAIAVCNALVDRVDLGAGSNGALKIYTAPRPSLPSDAPTGATLLATFTLQNPAFGSASLQAEGVVAALLGVPLTVSASATGTAAWYRIEDTDGNGVIDGEVTATGGGGDLEIDDVNIVSGGNVTINSLKIKVPRSPTD